MRVAFIAFIALVAITGGSVRADTLSLIVLRPMAVVFGAYVLFSATPGALSAMRGWFALIGITGIAIIAHLIPLPPALWHALPGREPVVAVDALLGLGELWRPFALSPAGAWNALLSLLVPLAGLLLFANLQSQHRRIMLDAWIILAMVSAALGLAQMLVGGALYTYGVTNRGTPVGLLANANHQAAFLAAALPLLAFRATRSGGQRMAGLAATGGGILLLAITILLTGSRAGIAIGLVCLLLTVFVLGKHLTLLSDAKANRGSAASGSRISPGVLVGAGILGVVSAGFAWLLASQGVTGLLLGGGGPELRIVALPTIFTMLERGWAFGFGAGSFPAAFQMFEPTGMLSRYYLNHAHNDWLEPILDFGLAGLLLLGLLLVMVASVCRKVLRAGGLAFARKLCLLAPIGVFAVASLVDYPLRVPIVQLVALLWLAALGSGELLQNRRRVGR